ncbi:MAG: MerR family transcriptional regulator [Cellulomonas sp.]|uniref:MerR family transcriptional regulator n=2 Tax=unclassified Cellulomonas TaxID=2620175 RepID=UPI00258E9DB2|nr:MerR family transcriptional regulator [Cellulomonas sp.]MCR6649189.1 MerR family transcriptional regulator [Cellulomonas sp.]MCR6705168.1 MerR family transcriptional regulator [Cellulomonas sp.]
MSYRIAEVAGLVGVPATTLRYYEDIGLVTQPARGGNGYRSYDDDDIARLRFITATKNLGIPLTDVADLVKAYDLDDCSSVAHQVVEMVAVRLVETQTRIGELVALAAQLQRVSARLAEAETSGPCGQGCPCATAAPEPLADRRTFVPLTRAPGTAPDAPVIACSLDAGSVPDRVAEWQGLGARAVRREPIAGGVALEFVAAPELVAEVARLAAAEQDCCTFFDFTVRLTTGQIRLEVRAPDHAADVVAAMFGTAA